jgi:hypothetical protein
VHPSRTPIAAASLISAMSALSMKIFMALAPRGLAWSRGRGVASSRLGS